MIYKINLGTESAINVNSLRAFVHFLRNFANLKLLIMFGWQTCLALTTSAQTLCLMFTWDNNLTLGQIIYSF
jgi:hypothetical protein